VRHFVERDLFAWPVRFAVLLYYLMYCCNGILLGVYLFHFLPFNESIVWISIISIFSGLGFLLRGILDGLNNLAVDVYVEMWKRNFFFVFFKRCDSTLTDFKIYIAYKPHSVTKIY